ncbi:MAG: hypothetical protein KF768_01225 [Phycisphaeraceae bacterium]|nr:hypothetical protein [Phycisphaeraceae bacterium]
MQQAVLRWTLPLAALLAVGPIAWMLTSHLQGPDGASQASLLLSTSPVLGLLCGIGVMFIAGGYGLLTARLIGPHFGLFSTGLILAWAAWGTGAIDAIARSQTTLAAGPPNSKSFFLRIAIEAAVLAPLAVGAAWAMIRFGKPPTPNPAAHHPHPPEPSSLSDPRALLGFVATAVVGGVLAWLVAQESSKGQTFAAAAFAGLFGAVAGRLAAAHVSGAAFVAGIAALGVIGPIVALSMGGPSGTAGAVAGGALRLAASGQLFNLARPLPLDWLAGAFVGVPIGLSWAASMIVHHHHDQPHTRPSDRRSTV